MARAVYADGQLGNLKVIFQTDLTKSGTQHFGSRLCLLPDGSLLVSIGDGGNPPTRLNGRLIHENAQDTSNQLGSLVRINDDGSIPEDSPLKGPQGKPLDIFSFGHRDIPGLAYDPIRKKIWATEHGALGGDELNQPQAGMN